MKSQSNINYMDHVKSSIFLLLNANVVHPREVFKMALAESAAHIIVAHNHPSGDPAPSREDIEITKKLVETGSIMGITVLDHVIIGDGRHFSMKEAGHI
jgi:DNA repair protein RadC